MRYRFNGCNCCTPVTSGVSRRTFLAGAGAAALAAGTALPATRSRAATPFRIDVHHHIFLPEVKALQDKLNPGWAGQGPPAARNWTPATMIADMDANNVASVVVATPGPGAWYGNVDAARQISRLWNETTARLAQDHRGRVGFFALIAPPDVEGTLKEIEYAFDVLKADGVGVYTSYGKHYLGDKAFAPIFEELNRRKAVVFVHPLAGDCCGAVVPGIPTNAYELPFDTTRAIASLMFGGTLTKFPDVRFIFSHGGGAMPMLARRIDELTKDAKALRENVPQGVPAALQSLYVDTAGAFSPAALSAVMKTLPASHVLYGSDFPYSPSAGAIAGLVENEFSGDVLRGIERDNALALFPRLKG
jgi:predicted TIM-barrel fold metal-dependent hydrolase